MNHEDFVRALADCDAGSELPAAAEAHAAGCAECRALQDALARIGDDEPAVPEGYWDDFNDRLAARLAAGVTTTRRPWHAQPAWRAAAAVLLAVGITWTVGQVPSPDGDAPAPADDRLVAAVARAPDVVLAETDTFVSEWGSDDAVDADDSWPAGDWLADDWMTADTTWAASVDGSPLEELPVDALEDELFASLDDDAVRDLTRRLREATSS